MPTDVTTSEPSPPAAEKALDFLRQKVAADLACGKCDRVITRFPPEPNGYPHLGHVKAICIDFGIAAEAGAGRFTDGRPVPARCHLRFDDTNPTKEEQEFVDAIKADVKWLGFDWGEHEYYASDYFEQLYDWACELIKHGHAYVDDQSAEDIRKSRGTLTEPGKLSPHRDRSPDENLDLFTRMRNGEFKEGEKVLRAKIDMASGNLNMRDPVMYRILHAVHPHSGDKWCIYPMYDWAHGQSDWIEGITHSLCSLEFEDHRPLYNWFVETLMKCGCKSPNADYPPQQTEFNRLNVTHTLVSKRKLRALVEEKHVRGWDDPRMPTLRGMRRRGYPPAALRAFVGDVGLSKRDQTIAMSRLEYHVREELNRTAPRVMAVLRPLKLVITNYPQGQVEQMTAVNNPEDEAAGTRQVPFGRELYIEADDFMVDAPKKYFRLAPGREVRLRYGYWVTATDYKTDDAGEVTEVYCTYDPATKGGDAPPPDADGNVRKVKGTIHWVSAAHAIDAEVRLYDTLFAKEDPDDAPEGGSWRDNLNPQSLEVLTGCKVEPSLSDAKPGDTFQFERTGYFCVDADSPPGHAGKLVFNRTVTLKDSWGKMQGRRATISDHD